MSQAQLTEHHQKIRENETAVKERTEMIESMVEKSTKLPEEGDTSIWTIDLREDAILDRTATLGK